MKVKRAIALVSGVVMFAIIGAGGLLWGAQEKAEIKIAGADSMFGRINGLSRIFMKQHPDVKIEVEQNGLVSQGMKKLIGGEADAAMASRKATAAEMEAAKGMGFQLVEHLIGYGGIVIIAHPGVSIDELTVDQIKMIFTGAYKNWKEVGGEDVAITVFRTGEKHPGTLAFIEDDILKEPITKDAQVVQDFPTVMQKVAETPGAIAYTRIRDPFESVAGRAANIKPIKVKKDDSAEAVAPSRDSVKNGSYPLRRPYFLYTTSKSNDQVKALAAFIVDKGWGEQEISYMWQ